jgi:hypothetical protein
MGKSGPPSPRQTNDALLGYASRFFSDHLRQTSSMTDILTGPLCKFFQTNVLSWIEYLAKTGDAHHIVHTAKNVKDFLDRRAGHLLTGSREMDDLNGLYGWTTDLIRVGTKFEEKLLTKPASIRTLIPAMCPSSSTIWTKYAKKANSVIVKGDIPQRWDDCLFQKDFTQDAYPLAVAHGRKYFAVGLSNGSISVFDTVSIRHTATLEHGSYFNFLAFSEHDKYILTCGRHSLRVWKLETSSQMFFHKPKSRILAIEFVGSNTIVFADQNNEITEW